jgi:hypothetical protein
VVAMAAARMSPWLIGRVLAVMVVAVPLVSVVATWRGQTENTSQPHVPGWQGTPRR